MNRDLKGRKFQTYLTIFKQSIENVKELFLHRFLGHHLSEITCLIALFSLLTINKHLFDSIFSELIGFRRNCCSRHCYFSKCYYQFKPNKYLNKQTAVARIDGKNPVAAMTLCNSLQRQSACRKLNIIIRKGKYIDMK